MLFFSEQIIFDGFTIIRIFADSIIPMYEKISSI